MAHFFKQLRKMLRFNIDDSDKLVITLSLSQGEDALRGHCFPGMVNRICIDKLNLFHFHLHFSQA
jgi:hypothetical protein